MAAASASKARLARAAASASRCRGRSCHRTPAHRMLRPSPHLHRMLRRRSLQLSPAASPLSGTPTTLPGKRLPTILVVEDHESNVIVLREMLESHGYHVLVAHTGSEGLARAFDDLPVLVLMDIHLPGMSGLEAIGRCGPTRAQATSRSLR